MSAPYQLRAVRGATTVEEDHPDILKRELMELFLTLIHENQLEKEDIVNVFFTVTPDLVKISPAKIIRFGLDWQSIPMMCSQEPLGENMPHMCVRTLIQFYTNKTPEEMVHVYLNRATDLRPDLFQ
ncbi:MAG: chorismate mutase [Vampirovibrio sp.]|nr:chorismate mutase [Vampirovibrio sp.]